MSIITVFWLKTIQYIIPYRYFTKMTLFQGHPWNLSIFFPFSQSVKKINREKFAWVTVTYIIGFVTWPGSSFIFIAPSSYRLVEDTLSNFSPFLSAQSQEEIHTNRTQKTHQKYCDLAELWLLKVKVGLGRWRIELF